MLFKKPKDLKYTEMCIYIDHLVERGNPTEEELDTAFKYLYHISFMLASKHKYFNQTHYYEDFAIFFATEVLNRLFLNPKLHAPEGEPSLSPIKSCLNYMKSIIYGRKVLFEQQNYSQKFSNINRGISPGFFFNDKIRDTAVSYLECDVDLYLKTISKVVKHRVYKKSHYRNDPVKMKNIYVSCLLSILNSITFTQADIDNIKNTYSLPDSKFKYITKAYKNNRENCIILYHLPENMRSYIKVLVREIYKDIENDIKEMSSSNLPISEGVLSEIVYLELDGKVNFD